MFEKYTDGARRVVILAQEEARLLNHHYIGTEHLLLGLAREGEGIAAKALESAGVSLDVIRGQVRDIIGQGVEPQPQSGHVPFTARGKAVLALAQRESLDQGQNHVGTEHLLLALLREGTGVAAQLLVKLGAGPDRLRGEVNRLLADEGEPTV
jgi:ATP-dependent Clp protease ATP-binding subunit ClpC